ncbi:hypothetical protein RLDS_21480 [Sphingobium lactosutens DS20]|uniref:Uncharacterized protein n=1 Tax=Sphingobium lactosutens DS20 TaxID=1331060 RepID=T0IJ01_9SPHN|nr:hypothetical protein RLDS_21480 [Sphingobium lactosutens DS20]
MKGVRPGCEHDPFHAYPSDRAYGAFLANVRRAAHFAKAPRDTLVRDQWWGVRGTVGGYVLAAVMNLGGLCPALTWTALAILAACRFLAPGNKAGTRKHDNVNDTNQGNDKKNEVVDMGKSMIRELAKAAPITVLFHTVGIDALSL